MKTNTEEKSSSSTPAPAVAPAKTGVSSARIESANPINTANFQEAVKILGTAFPEGKAPAKDVLEKTVMKLAEDDRLMSHLSHLIQTVIK